MVEIAVKCVVNEPLTDRNYLLMEAKEGGKVFPICIGQVEADIISKALAGDFPQSAPHSALCSIVSSCESSKIDRAVIDSATGEIFTAKLTVHSGGYQSIVDCRPSDAVVISLKTGVPLYIEDAVLQNARGVPV